MKRIHFWIGCILTLILLSASPEAGGQNVQIKEAEGTESTVYQQKLGVFDLQFIRSSQSGYDCWKTLLTDTVSHKEFLLQTDTVIKNKAWNYSGYVEDLPYKLYNINGAMLDDKDLYIIYCQAGIITLYKYHQAEPDKFEAKTKTLLGYFALPSYGEMTCKADFLKIGQDIYVSVSCGQTFRTVNTRLYRITPGTFDVKEIIFNPLSTTVCAVYVTDESKQRMDYLRNQKQEELSKHSKESLEILSRHLEQPYYLKKLKPKRKLRDREISQFNIWGFDLFHFWNYGNTNISNTQIISEQEKYIREVLLFERKGDNNNTEEKDKNNTSLWGFSHANSVEPISPKESYTIHLRGFINNIHKDPQNNIIYYFYSENEDDNDANIRIIRYDKYFSIWQAGDFSAIEIKDPREKNTESPNKNIRPNECWTWHLNQPSLRRLVKFFFYDNGTCRIIHDTGTGKNPYEAGTYYFQPESNEFFLSIKESNCAEDGHYKVKKRKYKPARKMCIRMIPLTEADSPSGSSATWYIPVFYTDWVAGGYNYHWPLGDGISTGSPQEKDILRDLYGYGLFYPEKIETKTLKK